MSALVVCVWVLAGVCLAVWVTSLVTREHSWVDRIWSIVPIAYVAIFLAKAGFDDVRLDLMLGLVVAWGARLTYKFARKAATHPAARTIGGRCGDEAGLISVSSDVQAGR